MQELGSWGWVFTGEEGTTPRNPASLICGSVTNFRNRLTEINRFIWGLLGLQPGRHKFKKHLNCVLLDYKVGYVCKGRNCKVTVKLHALSRIIIEAGKK